MRRRNGTKCCRGPSLLKQVQTFAGAMVSLTVDGPTSSHVQEQRLAKCHACEHLTGDRCELCGCFVSLKAKVMTERCPDGRWQDNGKWAVGMTTAPRRESTIHRALASHRLNGWEPTIFAEPGSDLEGIDAPIVQNPTRLGCWYNWVHQVSYLLTTFPDATHILTTQDDCQFVPGARELADWFDWPANAGLLSLYLPTKNSWVNPSARNRVRRPAGIQPIDQQYLYGSLALAFPREILQSILRHPIARTHGTSRQKQSHLVDGDDICIGRCINQLGLKMYYAAPSCSQHIGTTSSRETARVKRGDRMWAEWVAENAMRDCLSVNEGSVHVG